MDTTRWRYRVLGVDIDDTAGEAVVKVLDAGEQFRFHAADVSVENQVESYVAEAMGWMGGIGAFFNNAGIEGVVTPLIEQPVEAFDKVVAVNLRGVFLGLKHVMRQMGASGGGSIVNTASVAGLIGMGGLGAYVATKHAVVGLTKVAALEGDPSGQGLDARRSPSDSSGS